MTETNLTWDEYAVDNEIITCEHIYIKDRLSYTLSFDFYKVLLSITWLELLLS